MNDREKLYALAVKHFGERDKEAKFEAGATLGRAILENLVSIDRANAVRECYEAGKPVVTGDYAVYPYNRQLLLN